MVALYFSVVGVYLRCRAEPIGAPGESNPGTPEPKGPAMRVSRFTFRRRVPAATLAGALAVSFLGALAVFNPSVDDITRKSAPSPRPAATAVASTAPDDLVIAYNDGWTAGVADLGDGTASTYPNVVADGDNPYVVAWADGWVEGQANALGDDNADGRVDEDESGWDCATMGNRQCGPGAQEQRVPGRRVPAECREAGEWKRLCATVAARPAYAWTNPDGSTVSEPDGRAQIEDIDAVPGSEEFAVALSALDAQWAQHNR